MTVIDPRLELNHADLCIHTEVVFKVHGNETSWIGHVAGGAGGPGVVSIGCKQLQIVGDIDALEALLANWTALLADVRARPEDWPCTDYRRRRDEDGRVGPHPFTRRADGRPPANGPSVRPQYDPISTGEGER